MSRQRQLDGIGTDGPPGPQKKLLEADAWMHLPGHTIRHDKACAILVQETDWGRAQIRRVVKISLQSLQVEEAEVERHCGTLSQAPSRSPELP